MIHLLESTPEGGDTILTTRGKTIPPETEIEPLPYQMKPLCRVLGVK